jgi:hypothetical protein
MNEYKFMSRILLILLSTATIVSRTAAKGDQALLEFRGRATNSLQPNFLIQREFGTNGPDWRVEIDLTAQTNFPGHAWLKVLDPCGAKLRVWRTNDVELTATGTNGLASPAAKTTVSDVLNGIYRRYRGRQWWPSRYRGRQWWPSSNLGAASDQQVFLSSFKLSEVFAGPFTNDIVLQISPLIYRVDTNGVTANLVEFPPTKLKLTTGGKVEEIKN